MLLRGGEGSWEVQVRHDMFSFWQAPHIAALVQCWVLLRLWEVPQVDYAWLLRCHGERLKAAVATAACACPTVLTRADVCRALHMLHGNYWHVVHGLPLQSGTTPKGMGVFRAGLTATPLFPGKVFPAGLTGQGGAFLQCPDAAGAPGAGVGPHDGGGSGQDRSAAGQAGGDADPMRVYMRSVPWRGHGMPAAAAARDGAAPVGSPRRLLLLRVAVGHPTASLQSHLRALPGASGQEVHVVDLVSSRLAVAAALGDDSDSSAVLQAAMDAGTTLPTALSDAMHVVSVGASALIVVLDWGLSACEVDAVGAYFGVLPQHRHVADLPVLPVSYMVCEGMSPCCGLAAVQAWVTARCSISGLPANCGSDPQVSGYVQAAGNFLHDWAGGVGSSRWAADDGALVAAFVGMQLSPAAIVAALKAVGRHLLGFTAEQLGMLASMWAMQPGDGKWLHASGIIGGGKTTVYEAFMAMAHTMPGWSVVATAQTNAGTLAVNGDKCLEALLEISYIRDRLVYFLSDMDGQEWTKPITLSHVVLYLSSPEVRAKLEEKLAPLSHLIIDEVSQVNKLLMTLVVIVVMIFKPVFQTIECSHWW